jgi:hypothetical protein
MSATEHTSVWPANAADPNASTLLTASDMIDAGGGAALRNYISGRLAVVAREDPATPADWAAFAIAHILERTGDHIDGGVEVSASALQMTLAYVAYLETAVAAGGAA